MTIIRRGSPVLFVVCCVIIFLGFLLADRNSCVRGAGVRQALAHQAHVDLNTADRFWLRAHYSSDRHDSLLVRLDIQAYRDNLNTYRNLNVAQLQCPLFFPQVHDRKLPGR